MAVGQPIIAPHQHRQKQRADKLCVAEVDEHPRWVRGFSELEQLSLQPVDRIVVEGAIFWPQLHNEHPIQLFDLDHGDHLGSGLWGSFGAD